MIKLYKLRFRCFSVYIIQQKSLNFKNQIMLFFLILQWLPTGLLIKSQIPPCFLSSSYTGFFFFLLFAQIMKRGHFYIFSLAVPSAQNSISQNLNLVCFLLTFRSLTFLKSKSNFSVTLFRTLQFFHIWNYLIYLFHDLVSDSPP